MALSAYPLSMVFLRCICSYTGRPDTQGYFSAYSTPDEVTPASSLTTYNDILLVSRGQPPVISVYNSTNFQYIRNFTLATMDSQSFFIGMAVSPDGNYLYVADYHSQNVFRVNLPLAFTTNNVAISPSFNWKVNFQYGLLAVSVNKAKNVLVVGYYGNVIYEYSSTGGLVSQIPVESYPNQAVEQLNGALVVSNSYGQNSVRLITTTGTVLKSYGNATAGSGPGLMSGPYSLAVDKDGFILVCDYSNKRVLVLDPTLSEARILPTTNATGALSYPSKMWLDQSKGRLYVSENNPPYRVFSYGNMFNISEAFKSMWPVQ